MAKLLPVAWLVLALMLSPFVLAEDAVDAEFPGRATYSTIPVMELEDMFAQLDKLHVVDVRSQYEFDVLHVKGAKHVALNDPAFDEKIRQLKAEADLPVVFYCNGKTCYKSYKACDKAKGAGIEGAYAYDAGIFDWAKAHPEASVLLGRSPINPASLITKEAFEARLLPPEQFAEMVHSSSAITVIDIREPMQRAATSLFPNRQTDVTLDDAEGIEATLTAAAKSGAPVLIYDEAGKQVRWFQYYLEDKGIKHYYFMKGGSKAFFKEVLMM